jgi:hypothetical protein
LTPANLFRAVELGVCEINQVPIKRTVTAIFQAGLGMSVDGGGPEERF